MPDGVRVQVHCKENDADRIREGWPRKYASIKLVTRRLAGRGAIHSVGQSKVKPTMLSFFVVEVIVLICSIPVETFARPLKQIQFAILASRCAPMVPAETLDAVARTESGLNPLVLHDNSTGHQEEAGSQQLAVAEATHWLKRGDSVDIGLMQINSKNLASLGMTVSDALNPCMSLAGGAAILHAAYGGGVTPAEQQVALLMALSRYNTGTPFRGIMNGYARTVLENAGRSEVPLIPPSLAVPPSFVDPNAPPPWNVSAAGTYAQIHGASWLISLSPSGGNQEVRAGPTGPSSSTEAITSK